MFGFNIKLNIKNGLPIYIQSGNCQPGSNVLKQPLYILGKTNFECDVSSYKQNPYKIWCSFHN